MPFNCHWYEGVDPSLDGAAVKVILVPVQILPLGNAVILTEGATAADTDMVIALDNAVAGLAQEELDVKMQVTISPFANAAFE